MVLQTSVSEHSFETANSQRSSDDQDARACLDDDADADPPTITVFEADPGSSCTGLSQPATCPPPEVHPKVESRPLHQFTETLQSRLVDATSACVSAVTLARDLREQSFVKVDQQLDVLTRHLVDKVRNLTLDETVDSDVVDTTVEMITKGAGILRNAMSSCFQKADAALTAVQEVTETGALKSQAALDVIRQHIGLLDDFRDGETLSGAVPAFIEIAYTLYNLVAPLKGLSFSQVKDTLLEWSQLQRAVKAPYPPTTLSLQSCNVTEFSHQTILKELTYWFKHYLRVFPYTLLKNLQIHPDSDTARTAASENEVPSNNIVIFEKSHAQIHDPAYAIILDHATRSIVLIIRGSTSVQDILTDLCCAVDQQLGAHSGMLQGANQVEKITTPMIHDLCLEYPLYKVVVVGHSLGGGIGTLLTWSWSKDPLIAGPSGSRLHCYAFGPPCVGNRRLCEQLQSCVTSVIFGRDIVARASWYSIQRLMRILNHIADPVGGDEDPFHNVLPSSVSTPQRSRRDLLNCLLHSPIQDDAFADHQMKLLYDQHHTRTRVHVAFRTIRHTLLSLPMSADHTLLAPCGRCLLLVPKAHCERVSSRDCHQEQIAGTEVEHACVLVELTNQELFELASEIVVHQEAFEDHGLPRMAAALGFRVT